MKQFNLSVIALVLFSLVSCNTTNETIPNTFENLGNGYVINYEYNGIEYDIRTKNTDLTKDIYLVQEDKFMHSPVCDKTCQNLYYIFKAIHHYGYDTLLTKSAYYMGTTDGTSFNFSSTGVLLYAHKRSNKIYISLYQKNYEEHIEQVYEL